MMMMNCFCGMVDRWKAFSLISSRNHCQRYSPSRISDTTRTGFEPAQNLSSSLVEWSCVVVITTTFLGWGNNKRWTYIFNYQSLNLFHYTFNCAPCYPKSYFHSSGSILPLLILFHHLSVLLGFIQFFIFLMTNLKQWK